jgi:outer membrane immunogenic protein
VNACTSTGGGSSTCQMFAVNSTLSGSQDRWGWVAGVGLEYGLTENWSAKIEYDYLGFGTKTVNWSGTACAVISGPPTQNACSPFTRSFDINQNIQLLKFGVNYRFNTSGFGN